MSHIVFIVNSVTFYKSHRIDLVEDLRDKGLKVSVWCGNVGTKDDFSLADELFEVNRRVPTLKGIMQLKRLVRGHSGAHFVVVSPLMIIVFRALFVSIHNIYYNFSGLGELRKLPDWVLKSAFWLSAINLKGRNRNFVFQNENDLMLFQSVSNVRASNAHLIEGSGYKRGLQNMVVRNRKKLAFGYVGRISKKKGITTLLRAYDEFGLKDKIDLVIWGKLDEEGYHGFNKKDLEMIQRNPNVFRGYSDDKQEIYRSFDIFCLASDGEGISKSAVEACAYGKPLLISDVPGGKDLLQGNGRLFIHDNLESVVENIHWFIENRDAYMRMSKLSQEQFERKFSHERILSMWYNLVKMEI